MGSTPALRAILLAGGQSQRFGQPKALVDYRGQALVIDRYQALLAIDPSPIVLAGALARTIRSHLPSAEIISDPQQGPVRALEQVDIQGNCLLLPVDMPLLTSDHLRAFCQAAEGSAAILGDAPATLPCILRLPLERGGPSSLRGQLERQEARWHMPPEIRATDLGHFNKPEELQRLLG